MIVGRIVRPLGIAALLGSVSIGACRKATVEAGVASGDAGADPSADGTAPPVASVVLPARCRSDQGTFALDDGGALEELEIGDAIRYPGGLAVALVRRAPSGRVAAAALLGPDARGPLRIVDLGPTLGDAPPPRIGWFVGEKDSGSGDAIIAASYAARLGSGQGESTRELTVQVVSTGAPPTAILSIAQQRDDSLAFDLAFAGPNGQTGMVVWDEETASRGVVRAASFSASARPRLAGAGTAPAEQRAGSAPARDVSPPESDADLPRVVPGGSGFFVFWVAHRPDPAAAATDASDLEATGEERAYGWLEMIPVDAHGAVAGPLRRLTPASGHVSAYDVQPLSEGGHELLVVARDDGEAIDGSGGALLRIRVAGGSHGDAYSYTIDAPVGFPTDGLGRGAPAFVAGDPPWLTWVGPHEQLRLLPLDTRGAPALAPSAEESLSDERPLLVLPGGRLLVAAPADPVWQLRTVSCAR